MELKEESKPIKLNLFQIYIKIIVVKFLLKSNIQTVKNTKFKYIDKFLQSRYIYVTTTQIMKYNITQRPSSFLSIISHYPPPKVIITLIFITTYKFCQFLNVYNRTILFVLFFVTASFLNIICEVDPCCYIYKQFILFQSCRCVHYTNILVLTYLFIHSIAHGHKL